MYSASSMASSSSSSSYARNTYDVFLNFRGMDTRNNGFVDCLYTNLRRAGVNVFHDYEGLQRGQSICNELLKAIEESKISIIIFSKNYASSRWCLDELVKIMECSQKLNGIVFPIFYYVDPSMIRKQTGMFGKALAQHRKRLGDQKVNEWVTALIAAANLSGWDLQGVGNG